MDNIQYTQIGTDNTGEAFGDFLFGDSQVDIIDGLGGNDYLAGAGGNDLLFGWTGNDTIEGGTGSDLIMGEAGDDRLIGSEFRGNYYDYPELINNPQAFANEPVGTDGGAIDTLLGGSGADTFVLGDYFSSHYRGSGYAVIKDFNPQEGDKLEVFGNVNEYAISTGEISGDGTQDLLIEYQGNLIGVLEDYTGTLNANDIISSQAALGVNFASSTESTPTADQLGSPGDTLDTALYIGEYENSTISVFQSIGGGDALDFYQFSLSDAQQFGAAILPTAGDTDLALYNSQGQILEISAQGGTALDGFGATLAAGDYYLGVSSFDGVETDYELAISVSDITSTLASRTTFDDFGTTELFEF